MTGAPHGCRLGQRTTSSKAQTTVLVTRADTRVEYRYTYRS